MITPVSLMWRNTKAVSEWVNRLGKQEHLPHGISGMDIPVCAFT